jgi:hypothetical protein
MLRIDGAIPPYYLLPIFFHVIQEHFTFSQIRALWSIYRLALFQTKLLNKRSLTIYTCGEQTHEGRTGDIYLNNNDTRK